MPGRAQRLFVVSPAGADFSDFSMKVAALVSGGVDSSVALHLVRQAGHDVRAFYLKVWLENELEYLGQCPREEDLEYVRAVCEEARVPLEVISVQRAYWDRVIEHALVEIRSGRTPNPDVLCNTNVKFGAFLDAIEPGFERVVTGHYARVGRADGDARLTLAKDAFKDQTYFLANLSAAQLARAEFPIGSLEKREVREMAGQLNLPNQSRPDSQGLCFLGKISFRDFVRHHLGERPGPIVEFETGAVLGEHSGVWFYTIGQRQGLGLSGGPWYVVKKDLENNRVLVSRDYFTEDKPRNSFRVSRLNWLRSPESSALRVKVRHGEHFYHCTIVPGSDFLDVTLDAADQGIAPGQYAVFYEEDVCLGCGVIEEELAVSRRSP